VRRCRSRRRRRRRRRRHGRRRGASLRRKAAARSAAARRRSVTRRRHQPRPRATASATALWGENAGMNPNAINQNSDGTQDYGLWQLNTKTLNCMTKMFDYYIDNTNECRDIKFEIEGNSHVLRDLLIEDMQEGTMYDNLLILSARVYKNKLVMPELTNDVNKQFLDLYFIQDVIHGKNVEHGHCYQPCAAPNPPGIQRERNYNKDGIGNGVGIWSNEEVVHFNSCSQVDVYGSDDSDLTNSYLTSINDFTVKMPSTFIYPWIVTAENVYSQKYFIVMGYAKLRDDQNSPNYTLPETNFLNWLFLKSDVLYL
jgi:hypothetical protein